MASLASFDPYSIKPGKFEPSEFVRPAKKQKKEKAAPITMCRFLERNMFNFKLGRFPVLGFIES